MILLFLFQLQEVMESVNCKGWIILALGCFLLNFLLMMRLTYISRYRALDEKMSSHTSVSKHFRELQDQLAAKENKILELEDQLLAEKERFEKELAKLRGK